MRQGSICGIDTAIEENQVGLLGGRSRGKYGGREEPGDETACQMDLLVVREARNLGGTIQL
jgi:hypothetical protein